MEKLIAHRYFLFLAAIFVFVIIFSLSRLTSWPNVWFDEGLGIEIARNFLLFGKLDISTAPNVFSGLPYIVGTIAGYPVTIPLAGIFSIFGFGLVQARLFMLFWMLAAMASVYYVVKYVFGSDKAIMAAALIATFAPFYGNGLTVFGEVPGFVFLIWGLFFLLRPEKQNYYLAGLFFALAAVTKPSSYLLLFPAFAIFIFISERNRFFRKIFKFSLGAILPLVLWIALVFPNPFSLATWRNAVWLFRYPFGPEFSITESLLKNIRLIFTHSTLIYFLLFILVIIFCYFKATRFDFIKKKWFVFFFIYAIFAFLYFLKSPGWLRYVFAFEFMIFMFLPFSLKTLALIIFRGEGMQKYAFFIAAFFILSMQVFHLFYFRNDFYSPYPVIAASFINENLAKNEEYKVGFLNLPEIAGLIHPLKKFHIITRYVKPDFGENPLSFPKNSLPRFIVFETGSAYAENYKDVLEENYSPLKIIGNYNIYELK